MCGNRGIGYEQVPKKKRRRRDWLKFVKYLLFA
jgi:hypothetical protein